MAFAQNLEKCFHILTQGQIYTEEELCIKLEDALLLCNKFSLVNQEIVILHNPNRMPVEYALVNDWNLDEPSGTLKASLLSDTLYVTYSPIRHSCRIFFMRNRLKKGSEFVNRFYTGLAQLDLLSSYSEFQLADGNTSCVLKASEVLSVADYGIFYKTDNGYDMRVYSADLITPLQEIGVEPRRVVVFRGSTDQRRVSAPNWIEDYEGFGNLRSFGKAIEELLVGQPVTQAWKDALIKTLSGMDGMKLPEEFLDLTLESVLGALCTEDESFEFLRSVKSVVMINVDEY